MAIVRKTPPALRDGAARKRSAQRNDVTSVQKDAFLAQLRLGLSVAAAAAAAKVARRTFYLHAAADPEFKRQWDDAYDEGTDRLEDQVVKLGVKEGNIVALIFTLKARRPEKYRENQQVFSINNAQMAFVNAMQRLEQPGAEKFIEQEAKAK